jgi:plasmid stabilization system protein ParE
MKVTYSRRAFLDVSRLKEFIEIKSPSVANRIANQLIKGIDNLLSFPDIGKEVNNSPNPDSVRDIYILDYHVRYLKLKNSIFIIRIWHQKEDR